MDSHLKQNTIVLRQLQDGPKTALQVSAALGSIFTKSDVNAILYRLEAASSEDFFVVSHDDARPPVWTLSICSQTAGPAGPDVASTPATEHHPMLPAARATNRHTHSVVSPDDISAMLDDFSVPEKSAPVEPRGPTFRFGVAPALPIQSFTTNHPMRMPEPVLGSAGLPHRPVGHPPQAAQAATAQEPAPVKVAKPVANLDLGLSADEIRRKVHRVSHLSSDPVSFLAQIGIDLQPEYRATGPPHAPIFTATQYGVTVRGNTRKAAKAALADVLVRSSVLAGYYPG